MPLRKHIMRFGNPAVPPPTNSGQPPSTPSTEEPAAPPPTVVNTIKPSSLLDMILCESFDVQRAIARNLDRVSYDSLRSTSRYLRYSLPDPKFLYRKRLLNKWLGLSCDETRAPLTTFASWVHTTINCYIVDDMFSKYYPPGITRPIPCEVSTPIHKTQLMRCDHDIGGHHKLGEFFFCKKHQLKTREQLSEFVHLRRGIRYKLCDRCVVNRLKSVSIAEDRFTLAHDAVLGQCECASEFIGLHHRTMMDQNRCKFCSLRPFFDWHYENRRLMAEQERKVQNCGRHPLGLTCDCQTCIGCHETYISNPGGDWRCEGWECGHCKIGTFSKLPAAMYPEEELRKWEAKSSEDDVPSLEEFFRLIEISESPSAP